MKSPTTPAAETTKAADPFTAARQLFNRRRALLEKADKLFEDASPEVQALCEAAEEATASKRIDVEPSSPASTA